MNRMSFFNSLSRRVPLALVGGILYGLLAYAILYELNLPSEVASAAAAVLFLFYTGSRFLILFSGIDSDYYSRPAWKPSKHHYEHTPFSRTAQWVGKFYHYHDVALFIVLMTGSLLFLGSLLMDWVGGTPVGNTALRLVISLIP